MFLLEGGRAVLVWGPSSLPPGVRPPLSSRLVKGKGNKANLNILHKKMSQAYNLQIISLDLKVSDLYQNSGREDQGVLTGILCRVLRAAT